MPWLGDSGSTTWAGRETMPRAALAVLMAPSSRTTLVSMTRCDSSESESTRSMARPASPTAAKGTTWSRSQPRWS